MRREISIGIVIVLLTVPAVADGAGLYSRVALSGANGLRQEDFPHLVEKLKSQNAGERRDAAEQIGYLGEPPGG